MVAGPGGFGCQWENAATSHTISVVVGAPGTAASGALPAESERGKTEAGPDGIRFASGNVAEFAVKDRAADITVITSVTDSKDRPAAITLIGLIRGRL